MTYGIAGLKAGNAIVPYESVSKITKEVDISSYITGATSISYATATFSADSNNQWRMVFNLRATQTPSTIMTLVFAGINFQNNEAVITYSGAASWGSTVATGDADEILVESGTAIGSINISGTVSLNAEPTWTSIGTTAAAVVETRGADQYIAPASDTVAGLVNTEAQTFAGVKTLDDGINLGESDLTYYKTGTFSPTFTGVDANPSITCRWTRIGEVVTLFLPGNWTETSNSVDFILNNIPTDIRTTSLQNGDIVAYTDNGTILAAGLWYINASSSNLNLYTGISGGGAYATWTASGAKGIPSGITMTWTIT